MAIELDHAKRASLQATFSPMEFKERNGVPARPQPGQPAIERAVPLRAFRTTKGELAAVLKKVDDPAQQAILVALGSRDPSALIAAVNKHDIPDGAVVSTVLDLLNTERRDRVGQARETVGAWIEAAEERLCASVVDAALAQAQAGEPEDLESPEGPTEAHSDPELSAATSNTASRARNATVPKPGRGGGGGGTPAEPSPHDGLRERLRASVAARLHGPCSPGGRLVSGQSGRARRHRRRLPIDRRGDRELREDQLPRHHTGEPG